jgi:hypothetical protein
MLQQLTLEDMTFGVFPVVDEGFDHPWYHDIGEVFDVVIQLLEVWDSNILILSNRFPVNFLGLELPSPPPYCASGEA